MSFTHTETNIAAENEYPKLVRDKIPEIIEADRGVAVPTRVLADDAEYERYLRQKLIEEATELAQAETDQHTIEEIADVEELIDALLALKQLKREEVLAAQTSKREARGGFAKRLLMLKKA